LTRVPPTIDVRGIVAVPLRDELSNRDKRASLTSKSSVESRACGKTIYQTNRDKLPAIRGDDRLLIAVGQTDDHNRMDDSSTQHGRGSIFLVLKAAVIFATVVAVYWLWNHKPAPDFNLQTLDGRVVKLSDLKGKVVLVDFWATWCPPCRASLPHIQRLSDDRSMAYHGLKVLAINSEPETSQVQAFLQSQNFTFTVPMDAGGKTASSYGVSAIPATFLIGRDGVIRKRWVGFGPDSAAQIDAAIASAMDEPGDGN